MNRNLHLAASLLFVLISGCAPSTINNAEQQGATVLTAQEDFDLSSENTLRLISSDFDAFLYFSPDGSLSASSIFNKNYDYGIWDIKDDGKICIKFNIWYYGDLNCYSTYNDAENNQYLLFTDNGALAYTATASPGNSENIPVKTKKDKKPTYVRNQMSKSQTTTTPVLVQSERSVAPATPAITSSTSKEEVKHTVKSMAQNCPNCNFEDADLRQAHLVGANLQGANLKGADLSRANLRRANLEGTDLSGATLLSSNLPGANLKNAILKGADFTGSNLIQTDFTNANIDGAIFDNTLQEGTKGLKN